MFSNQDSCASTVLLIHYCQYNHQDKLNYQNVWEQSVMASFFVYQMKNARL